MTTGFDTIRPIPRIAHSGRLMIGVNASMPYIPRLVSVNVPPVSSSRVIAPERVFSIRDLAGGCDVDHAPSIGVADHRCQQTSFGVNGHADVDVVVLNNCHFRAVRHSIPGVLQRQRG